MKDGGVVREGDEIVYDLRQFPPGLVAVPVVPWMYTASAKAFLHLSHRLPPGSALWLSSEGSSSVDAVRNHIVESFMAQPEWKWLCMIDSDMTPPPHAVAELLGVDVDIVAAKCFQRYPPFFLTAALLEGGDRVTRTGCTLVEAVRTGFGCILIRRRVLERMSPPWFQNTIPGMGEDFAWCERARGLGFRIYIDEALDVGHLGIISVDQEFASSWWQTESGKRTMSEYAQRAANIPEWMQRPQAGAE